MMKKRTLLEKIRRSKAVKFLLAFTAINLVMQLAMPTLALALTAGAASPEFSSFEPVATTDMVNDFTGDFTYNLPVLSVPGPDGGGYSMSLSYHSGVSSEEESSWVGFGWTLNPGAINRQKRGFPDDYNNVKVEHYNKTKPNWTQTAKFDLNMEYNSNDKKPKEGTTSGKALSKILAKLGLAGIGSGKQENNPDNEPADVSLSVSHTVRYNNYSGFSIANGYGVTGFGMATLSMNRAGGENTFGFSVNPMAVLRRVMVERGYDGKKKHWEQRIKFDKLMKNLTLKGLTNGKLHSTGRNLNSSFPIHSYNAPALSYSVAKHSGAAYNFSGSIEVNPYGPIGFQVGVAGHFNITANRGEEDQQVYGFMYSDQNNSNAVSGVLHDYQIEKESTFDKHDNNLGIPFNNADIFSATGNGVVGGFRLYHDKIGNYYPNYTDSKIKIKERGVELGIRATRIMKLTGIS